MGKNSYLRKKKKKLAGRGRGEVFCVKRSKGGYLPPEGKRQGSPKLFEMKEGTYPFLWRRGKKRDQLRGPRVVEGRDIC